MKAKRFLTGFLVACIMFSAFSVTAMAKDNTDKRIFFYFSDEDGRSKVSSYRQKEDTSPIYFRTENGSLPYKGYCINAVGYHPSESTGLGMLNNYSSTYLINDYHEYLLRCDKRSAGAGHFVALQGTYPFTTYSWGDVTIWWSPDSIDTGGLTTLDPQYVTPVDPSSLS